MKILSEIFNYLTLQSRKKQSNFACKAPFNTLFFSMSGEVYFCLSNRIQIIGKYPQNSIKDVVDGETRNELQKLFIKNNGMPGCEYCKEQIRMGNYNAAFNQFSNVPSKKGEITVIEFELSNQCNLQCEMCSENYSSMFQGNCKKIKIPYDDQFVYQITPYLRTLKKASFRGGEPFLISIYYKIWDKLLAQNKDVIIGITTNGTIYNSRVEKYLYSGQFHISISIDSLQKETFEKIRINGNFEQYIQNINNFLKLSKKGICGLSVCTCILINNWKEIPAIFQFCNKNKLNIRINYVESPFNVSIKSLPKNEIEAIFLFLNKNKNNNDYNIKIYNTILSILQSWAIKNSQIKKPQKFNDIYNLFLPLTISHSDLKMQKELFLKKIEKNTQAQHTEILYKLELLETELNKPRDILFLYLTLNILPESLIIDKIIELTIERLKDKSVEIIEFCKQKTTING